MIIVDKTIAAVQPKRAGVMSSSILAAKWKKMEKRDTHEDKSGRGVS